jgi:hypothetical protein
MRRGHAGDGLVTWSCTHHNVCLRANSYVSNGKVVLLKAINKHVKRKTVGTVTCPSEEDTEPTES